MSCFLPYRFQPYGLGAAAAAERWRALGQLMCRAGDVLVFSDTIPDARPLLEGGCTTPMLLQVTNRFDYGVSREEMPAFLGLMAGATRRPRVWWAPNNPYEQLYMAKRGVLLPSDRTRMLRPVGTCLLQQPQPHAAPFDAATACGAAPPSPPPFPPSSSAPPPPPPPPPPPASSPRASRLALLIPSHSRYHLEVTVLTPWLMSHNLSSHVDVYHGASYGGPAVLAQHRGVLTVPYQVSVMKMYEGLAAGAVFILPSPALFRALLAKLGNGQMVFCCRELLEDRPRDWRSYMDWYHPDFMPAHITYDSLDELRGLIADCETSAALVEAKRAVGQAALAASRAASLAGFSQLFAALQEQACGGPSAAEEQAEGLTGGVRRHRP
ncbi:hypothetical protein GPECTOR_32g418 [Gonium pectorale]|uniref:Uncharacterized protein n=1 Tax=Gonium pectorale TaxID=33097 RepID=A0A150GD93_GONPE|nr:hypothetical protein GPECTOR_32g418 [Gonium pectorale]|eukprot:KXZ47806.1 hypothetical protein GPECTOR_32g418 [Gonium pectorale]